jgi:hypothetical protein
MLIKDLLPKELEVMLVRGVKGRLQDRLFAQARRDTRKISNMIDPIKVTKLIMQYPGDQKDNQREPIRRYLMAIPSISLWAVILVVNWAMEQNLKSMIAENLFVCPNRCHSIF